MKKTFLGSVLVVLAVVLISSCAFGPSFDETAISGTGTFGTWTFGSGTCRDNGDDTYSIDLFPLSGDDKIMFTASSSDTAETLELNIFDLQSAKTVTYFDGTTNHILIDGSRQVTVDAAAGTAVVRLNAYSDDVNFNGTVTLDVTN